MTDYFHLDMGRDQLLALSSLGLAHLGDSVFEVMVRSWLCLHGKAKVKDLHRATVTYVAAPRPGGWSESCPCLPRRRRMSFGVDEIPRPTRSPRRPAGENTRLPPDWRPCLDGCISKGGQSGSISCLK